ncbi:hypothetical protein C5B94_08785, partial [Clavibacter michiganensis]
MEHRPQPVLLRRRSPCVARGYRARIPFTQRRKCHAQPHQVGLRPRHRGLPRRRSRGLLDPRRDPLVLQLRRAVRVRDDRGRPHAAR